MAKLSCSEELVVHNNEIKLWTIVCAMAMNSENNITLSINRWLEDAWEKRDKRVDDWWMMSSPVPTLILVIFYLLITLKFGYIFMRNRKPFNFPTIMIVYNFIMMILNAYIVYYIWVLAWGNDYSWQCEPLDRSLSSRSLKIATLTWLYFVYKFLDWIDTLFIILKKKFNQMSALHIYHHASMPLITWMAARFMPGGHMTFNGLLNCSVHVVMHFYYAMAAMGSKYQKYLWWKKYLTTMQMVQFAVCVLHACQALFIFECGIDLPLEWGYMLILPHPIVFFFLFLDFYLKSYKTKEQSIMFLSKNNIFVMHMLIILDLNFVNS